MSSQAWLSLLSWARQARQDFDANTVRDAYQQGLLSYTGLSQVRYVNAGDRSSFARRRLYICDNSTCDHACVDIDRGSEHRVEQAMRRCRSCEQCGDCCECVFCSGCANAMSGDDACADCEQCGDCCECVSCSQCESRFNSGSDAWCSGCRNERRYTCDQCCQRRHGRGRVQFFTYDVKFHAATRLQRKRNASKRFIAAEIEVASVDGDDGVSDAVRAWRGCIVRDGSLPDTGFEINTAPASGDLYVTQIREVCAALKTSGAEVTSACGLHVHVDAADLRYYELQRVVRLYAAWESLLFQMVPASRRRSTYCQPCGASMVRALDARATPGAKAYKALRAKVARGVYGDADTRSRRKSKYDDARYSALNLHSWFYRGTLECRLFTGTTDPAKIIPWGLMWARIADLAVKLTDREVADIAAACGPTSEGLSVAYVAAQYQTLMTHVVAGDAEIKAFIDARLRRHAYQAVKDAVGLGAGIGSNDTTGEE